MEKPDKGVGAAIFRGVALAFYKSNYLHLPECYHQVGFSVAITGNRIDW